MINQSLLIVLVEWWHSNTNTFHLVTGKIMLMPEDMYKILWISIVEDLLLYEHTKEGDTEALQ